MDKGELREKFEAHWQGQVKGGDGSWTTLERLAALEAYQAAYIAGLREAAETLRGLYDLRDDQRARMYAAKHSDAILARADELEKGR